MTKDRVSRKLDVTLTYQRDKRSDMAEPPPYPDHDVDSNRTPRWVKVFGIIAVIVVLLFVIMLLTGGAGRHGPGRHGSGPGHQTAPSAMSDGGAQSP